MEVGEREIIYLSLHYHHQNDFCIKMGSDESHFNVSVGSDGQRRCPQTTTFLKRKESRNGIEPRSFGLRNKHKQECLFNSRPNQLTLQVAGR